MPTSDFIGTLDFFSWPAPKRESQRAVWSPFFMIP